MPMYDFSCPDCGEIYAEYRPLVDWNKPQVCPKCQHMMVHAVNAPAVRGNYKKPIISDAMGFIAAPEDVSEHRRRFPDIDLDFDNGSARPIFRSLTQRRGYQKAVNWVDTKDFR